MRPINEKRLILLLEYIKDYQKDNGKSPSFRNILTSLKYKSLSIVSHDINILKERNLIAFEDNKGIITPYNLKDEGCINVPLLGSVPCGEPLMAIENIEANIKLPIEIFGKEKHIILKAKGRSMVKCGIFPQDLLVINIDNNPKVGDIVLARVNQDETTVKILAKKDNVYYLKPSSDDVDENGEKIYKDIYPMGEWDIIGIVSHVIHVPYGEL